MAIYITLVKEPDISPGLFKLGVNRQWENQTSRIHLQLKKINLNYIMYLNCTKMLHIIMHNSLIADL